VETGQHHPSPLSPFDSIASSPLGCAHEERMRTYEVRQQILSASKMIAEVLTKRVLLVACDLLASTPLILQRQKRMISLQHHAFRLREAKADRCKQIAKRLSISVIISIHANTKKGRIEPAPYASEQKSYLIELLT